MIWLKKLSERRKKRKRNKLLIRWTVMLIYQSLILMKKKMDRRKSSRRLQLEKGSVASRLKQTLKPGKSESLRESYETVKSQRPTMMK